MGIPSYFSYIINNYPNIIRKLSLLRSSGVIFDHLYMDCNSIIYDIVRNFSYFEPLSSYEDGLIGLIISKIEYFIDLINPCKTVYIAFDGVAPLAKMEQQRSRRYKNVGNNSSGWSTANITPGTEFMKKMSDSLSRHFAKDDSGLDIIVSTSNEQGEGEHKMFQYIRKQKIDPEDTGFVYGLDSDLIMLSIFHCELFKEFYIFREAPEFAKSLKCLSDNSSTDENSCCFMDIVQLSQSIVTEMRCVNVDKARIYDYVMLCFFLGNDFLPHFPSLNIRTHGMQVLLDNYRNQIGSRPDRFLISPITKQIEWKWMRVFIEAMAKNEHEYIVQEYGLREKWDKRTWQIEKEEDRDFTMQSIPVIYRAEEHYICPSEKGWETRYYKSLFHDCNVESLCKNYLEGLEWVFKYYTVDCPDWRWKYNYHYPPLLKDLCKHVPSAHYSFINNNRPSVNSSVQLAYVFPKIYHDLMPSFQKEVLQSNKYAHLYPDNYVHKWAFCRYLWESHVDLPAISEALLDELERDLMNRSVVVN